MNCEEQSKVTQVYDAILALMAGALKCHAELQDPENLEFCPPQQLKAGFGLSFAEGENTDRCIDACGYYQARNFDLILTRELLFVEGDIPTRTKCWKAMMEDMHRVIKAISGSHTIAGAVDQAGRTEVLSFSVKYVNDGGPVSTFIEGADYLFSELSVTAEYREPLTGGN
jgi:hypothetical protein